ncbi:MAG: peptidylprolyl isomerase [Planctomycetota bacterium]
MMTTPLFKRRLILVACVFVFLGPLVFETRAKAQRPEAQEAVAPLPSDPTAILAVVGESPILWGDIQPKVDTQIKKVLKSMGKSDIPQGELKVARLHLTRAALREAIQTKMMSESFLLEQVATQAAEKRREVKDMMDQRARQMFFENELPSLKEKFGTDSLEELDKRMQEAGTSLSLRQREFPDLMLGHMYMKSKLDKDPAISLAEITIAYRENLKDYEREAQARWEQLSVLFENHPSKDAARAKLIEMGGEAYRTNVFEKVAKAMSEEPFASDGGQHDWTSQGALASSILDQQIFSIPLNTMSEIIEDERGLHIIRVLERRPAGIVPLAKVQDEIREQLKTEKKLEAQKKMLAEMQNRVPVWSLYHKDTPGALPLQERR